jgi:coenzyme PQQ precursor peptide PqqA
MRAQGRALDILLAHGPEQAAAADIPHPVFVSGKTGVRGRSAMRWTKPSVIEISVGMEVTGYMPNDELPPEI